VRIWHNEGDAGLLRCLDCGKSKKGSGKAACWDFQKCWKCFHHGKQEFTAWDNMNDLRAHVWPTDLYMDRGMEHEIRELERNEN